MLMVRDVMVIATLAGHCSSSRLIYRIQSNYNSLMALFCVLHKQKILLKIFFSRTQKTQKKRCRKKKILKNPKKHPMPDQTKKKKQKHSNSPTNKKTSSHLSLDKRSREKHEDGSDGEARKSAGSDMRERGFREDDFIETRERRRGRVDEFHDPVNVDDDDDIDRDENDETTPTQSLRSSGKRGTHDWMLDGREIDFPRTRTNGAFRGTVGRRWSRPV